MNALALALSASLGSEVRRLEPLSGGDINDAYALTLVDGRKLFVKTHQDAPPGMYAREAEGLRWLSEARALPCPEVVAVDESFLVLSYEAPAARARDWDAALGRGLAALHAFGAPCFGLAHDNYIGTLPQVNTPCASFAELYREHRLRPLVARAADQLGPALCHRFDRLYDELEQLIPREPPARLHGDLWSGNVHTDARGQPMLIDPAVYGGSREVDLAMLQLFGAPSATFFAAYDELYPRAPGHEERVALFQLYPLLVHVNLFGQGYVGGLRRALSSYV